MRFFVLGTDGREYGPASVDELRNWIGEGRLDGQTRVRPENDSRWTLAGEQTELRPMLSALPVPTAARPVNQNLAVISLVLGLAAFVMGPLSGIPAIICGALARSRARQSPGEYGGQGYATAGLVTGCVGSLMCILLVPAMLLPAIAQAKDRAVAISCMTQMKQVGLAFHLWASKHGESFPQITSTNSGGTMEFTTPDEDGMDASAFAHFRILSDELSTARLLVCPADKGRTPGADFAELQPGNVSYLLRVLSTNGVAPNETVCTCPIHGHALRGDGSVIRGNPKRLKW